METRDAVLIRMVSTTEGQFYTIRLCMRSLSLSDSLTGTVCYDSVLLTALGYGKRICPGRHFADATLLLLSRGYSQFSVSGGQIVRSTPSAIIRTGYLSTCLSRYYSTSQIHFRVDRKADSGLLESSKSFPVPLDASRDKITEELSSRIVWRAVDSD